MSSPPLPMTWLLPWRTAAIPTLPRCQWHLPIAKSTSSRTTSSHREVDELEDSGTPDLAPSLAPQGVPLDAVALHSHSAVDRPGSGGSSPLIVYGFVPGDTPPPDVQWPPAAALPPASVAARPSLRRTTF